MTKQMTAREVTDSGKVIVGEFGFGSRSVGWIVCDPSDQASVQSAYDAIEEGDLGPNTLDGVTAAGGEYVEAV
jgi:hypothetical protein